MIIKVVGAVIVRDSKILAAKRSYDKTLGGMWEFPGGKIELGEKPEEALYREITEELDCRITVDKLIKKVIHSYDFATVDLTTYFCTLVEEEPSLTEHCELRWLSIDELDTVFWAPADLATIDIIKNKKLI